MKPAAAGRKERPQLRFCSPNEWWQWLEANGATTDGIWLQFAKKASGIASVTYAEALEAALCFGWIDGQRRALDGQYFLQLFMPRTRTSIWSLVNREAARKLIAQKRMQPAGSAAIEQAKLNGRWERAYGAETVSELPPELKEALAENRAGAKFFETLDRRNRYACVFRVQTAIKPETRRARARKFVEMFARGEKIIP